MNGNWIFQSGASGFNTFIIWNNVNIGDPFSGNFLSFSTNTGPNNFGLIANGNTFFSGSGKGLTGIPFATNATYAATATNVINLPTVISNNAPTIQTFTANTNGYAEVLAWNQSGGVAASSDFTAQANNGNSNSFYINVGINSGGYTAAGPAGTNTAYVLAVGNAGNTNGGTTVNLYEGAAQTNSSIMWSVGNGLSQTNMILTTNGLQLNVGQFTGNGGGLTNLPAVNLTGTIPPAVLTASGVVTTNSVQISQSWLTPGVYAYLTADSFIGNTNGYAPSSWPDITGRGHSLNLANVSYSPEGIGGKPALYFSGSGSLASNAFFNSADLTSLNTNITFFLVFKSENNAGGIYALLASGTNGTDGVFLYPQYTVYDAWQFQKQGANHALSSGEIAPNKISIVAISFNGSGVSVWRNGRPIALDSDTGTTLNGGLGLTSLLYLGRESDGTSFPWAGYYSDVIVYSNSLNQAQIKGVFADLNQKYRVNQDEILLEGESEICGNGSTAGITPITQLANYFHGYTLEICAMNGRNIATMQTNTLEWVSSKNQNRGVVWLHDNCGNSDNISQITNGVRAICNWCWSNDWRVVVSTPIDYVTGEPVQTNFVPWLQANWTNFCDGIIDISANTNFGVGVTNCGASTNSSNYIYYNGDHIHLSALGVSNWINGYVKPTLNTVLHSY